MGRGSRNTQEAITAADLRRARPGVTPDWASGQIENDPLWHAAKQSRRLLAAPAPGSSVTVDAMVLAEAVAELRAGDPTLDDPARRDAYQDLLKRGGEVSVVVVDAAARSARMQGGQTTAVLTSTDTVAVLAPALVGDRPVSLPARRLGLERVTDSVFELGDIAPPS